MLNRSGYWAWISPVFVSLGLIGSNPMVAIAQERDAALMLQDATPVAEMDAISPASRGNPAMRTATPELKSDPSLHDQGRSGSLPQVTSVTQLSDVNPTDWAFQAVQSLVERYGCIAGYPNSTFRGNTPATRYEMAAALNACLDQIRDRFGSKADLEMVKALQAEFATELASLRGRVDGLNARVATVEAQQFSTTTKLKGEVVFGFSGVTGDVADGTGAGNDIEDTRLSLSQRTRLIFLTSFSGRDRLLIRLQSQNRPINFSDGTFPFTSTTGTLATRLSFDTGDSESSFLLNRLDYKFPVGKDLNITVFANAALHNFYATTNNPYFEGPAGARGAISWFGQRNPIYRIGTVGVSARGVGGTYTPTDNLRFDLGYFATNAQSPVAFNVGNGSEDGGLFGGGYSALAQVSYKLYDNAQVGLSYLRNYAPDGNFRHGAGSPTSNVPFAGQALTGDTVALGGYFGLGERVALGGWVGYTFANQVAGPSNRAEILNALVNLAFLDAGREGATAGLIFGLPPHVVDNDLIASEDPDTPFHIELNYQFPVSKNIKITPGLIYLINPNGNDANGDIFVGAIRTTFTF